MAKTFTRRAAVTAVAASLLGGLSATSLPQTAAADDCSTYVTPVYKTTNPNLTTSLLTQWSAEYEKSDWKYGYTTDEGVIGHLAPQNRSGLTPITRMYNPTTADFLYAAGSEDVAQATAKGFQAGLTSFLAQTTASTCTVAVHQFNKGEHYATAISEADRSTLTSAGWTDLGPLFYVKPAAAPEPEPTPDPAPAPPPPDDATADTFTLAVIPDTQDESARLTSRMSNRTQWLVDNKSQLNLKYVLHTGDITNWGWVAPNQFSLARASADKLDAAGIPYVWAVGNHDTAVVGSATAGSRAYGGGAYVDNPECQERFGDQCKSWLLVRNTEAYNANFPLSKIQNVGGYFEAGKADNVWTTFKADGAKWLVLTLELFPRKEAVAWGAQVVSAHPDHNVIVQTHSYLTPSSTIDGWNGGYGSTSGQYVFDNLVKLYPNVKMVFSGHVLAAGHRVDTGVNGNKIVSYLGDFKTDANPVRLLTIDADTGKVTSRVYAPSNGQELTQFATNDTIQIIK